MLVQAENASASKRNGGDAVSMQASERALLAYFLARWQQLDADMIIGHNIGPWDLTILLQRLQHHKLPHFSRVGRLKRQRLPNLSGGGNMYGGGASLVCTASLPGTPQCHTLVSSLAHSLTACILTHTLPHSVGITLGYVYDLEAALELHGALCICFALCRVC